MSFATDNNTMCLLFNILRRKDATTKERRNAYLRMVEIYRNSAKIKGEWRHHPSEHLYARRFVHKCVKRLSRFDDGQNHRDLPTWGG